MAERAGGSRRGSLSAWSLTTWASLVGAILGAVLVAATFFFDNARQVDSAAVPRPSATGALPDAEVNQRLQELADRVASVEAGLQPLPGDTADPDALAGQLAAFSEELAQNGESLRRLEAVILEDPARALELPLLRRDLDNAQQINAQALASMRQDVDRQYDLMKWVVGTLALGLIGSFVSNVLPRRDGGRSGDE